MVLSADGVLGADAFAPAAGGRRGGGRAAAADVVRLKEAVADAERRAIRAALEQSDGNRAAAARLLGVSQRTLFYKLLALGLE